jgi:hypothetical protein
MSKKKYRLTDEIKPFGKIILYQIKALRSFGDVKEGDFGGYVESEHNISHSGNAWVSGMAWVFGKARISGDAKVFDFAWVYGNARVFCCNF